MERDELESWLRLTLTPGLGRAGTRHLLAACGSPQGVFAQTPVALAGVVGETVARALQERPPALDAALDRTLAWLDGDPTRAVVTLGDPRYPTRWLQTADPPLFVYAEGRVDLFAADAVAVVGSRNPTAQGEDTARDFARALSEAGRTVVSGLALGIDAAAHAGALEGPGGTIAIVGTGLDSDYPRRNAALARRIRTAGLMVSEYPLGAGPLAPHFPQRNRLIAGLARGTLVVEAALQSGSLITARQALDQGAEVFAVPGSIHSPQSRGCHALIKQGAKLVDSAEDILAELPPLSPPASPPAASAPSAADLGEAVDDEVLRAMGYDPVTQDQLAARTGWPAARLSARLLELELAGRVARLPGQRFQRRAQG
ncbi:MAG: DNA-processing protein DprA [Ideonella sp.]|nr:DNA-processing protein DprA [Ideonella sp.]